MKKYILLPLIMVLLLVKVSAHENSISIENQSENILKTVHSEEKNNLEGDNEVQLSFLTLSPSGLPLAQQTNNKPPREPVIAIGLSLLYPGLGQFYNGQNLKGGLLAGGFTLGLIIVAAAPTTDSILKKGEVAVLTTIPMFLIYLYSLVDAPVSASRINRKNNLGSVYLFGNQWIEASLKPDVGFHSFKTLKPSDPVPQVTLNISF